MSQEERVGVGGGRILAFDNGVKTDEQFIGGLFLGPTLSVVGGRRHREEECYVFRPSGCCPIMKREMLEEVFLATGEHYDSTYFAYGEDTDLCLRAQLMAWRAIYVPEAIAWHVGSSGRPIRLANKPLWLRKLALRNRYLTVIKDFPTSFLLILLPFLIIFQLLIWLRLFLSHPINGGRLFVEVWADVIRLVPVYLKKRQSVQLRRKASLPDLLRLIRFF